MLWAGKDRKTEYRKTCEVGCEKAFKSVVHWKYYRYLNVVSNLYFVYGTQTKIFLIIWRGEMYTNHYLLCSPFQSLCLTHNRIQKVHLRFDCFWTNNSMQSMHSFWNSSLWITDACFVKNNKNNLRLLYSFERKLQCSSHKSSSLNFTYISKTILLKPFY